MKHQKQLSLTLSALLCLGAGTASAAVPQDAETAVRQAVQAGSQVPAEKAQELAHTTLHVTGVDVAAGSQLTKEKILQLVPELAKSEVNVAKLGRQIALYNTNGQALQLAVNFTQTAGGYRAKVAGIRGKRVDAGISVSNNGSTYTGDWRGTVTYVDRNLSGLGDTLGAAVVSSLDHAGDVLEGAVSYRLPLAKAADTLTFSASASSSKLHDLSKGYPFDITADGESQRANLSYQHYLANSSREKDYWDFGTGWHHSKNNTDLTWGGSYRIGHYDFSHLDGYLSFQHRDAGIRHSFGYGLGVQENITGDRDDFRKMNEGTDKHYTIFHANAGYQTKLGAGNSWLFGARLAGQYTDDELIGCEKFGAGGRDSVRGFDENIRTADRGISGSLEFYTPVYLKGLRALAFVDGASLHNNRKGYGNTDLASYGLGLRYNYEQLHLSLDYAFIAHEPDSVEHDPQGHRRFTFWGGISF